MLETFGAACVLLVLLAVPAALLARLLGNSGTMIEQLIFSVAASAIAGGVLLAVLCSKNLIALYQASRQE